MSDAISKTTYRRLVRREQYRSRSLAIIVALVGVVLGAAYLAIESVLAAVGAAPLLVAPQTMIDALNAPSPALVAGAGVAIAAGLVLVLLAVVPGRLARHAIPHERLAIVVDDNVLAGALSRAARDAASVPAGRVRTTVAGRRAAVSIVPSSGFPVDAGAVETAACRVAAQIGPLPPVRVTVTVAPTGVVGS